MLQTHCSEISLSAPTSIATQKRKPASIDHLSHAIKKPSQDSAFPWCHSSWLPLVMKIPCFGNSSWLARHIHFGNSCLSQLLSARLPKCQMQFTKSCVTHPIASEWKVLKLPCVFTCAQSPYKALCKRSPKVCLHSGRKMCKIHLSQSIYSCWELSNLEPACPHVLVMKARSLVPLIWCHLVKVERRLRGKIKSANSPPLPEAF